MLSLAILWLCLTVPGCGSGTQWQGRSPATPLTIMPQKEKPAPAFLVVSDSRFEEPNGNRALDGGEVGLFYLTVANKGLGPGQVVVQLMPITTVEGLSFEAEYDVGPLQPGEEKQVIVDIRAALEVENGQRALLVEVLDSISGGSHSVELQFQTRAINAPSFRVVVRDFSDSRGIYSGNEPDGIVQAGEVVKVVVNVQNIGGPAEAVEVRVGAREGVEYLKDVGTKQVDSLFVVGALSTDENKDIHFFFFTSPVFTAEAAHLSIAVEEKWGKFGLKQDLSFDIGQRVKTQDVLSVTALPQLNKPVTLIESQRIDVEEVPTGSNTSLEKGIALIFAIEDYRYTFDAAYKHRDAAVFYRYCQQVLGIPAERILLRTNAEASKAEFDYVFAGMDVAQDGWLKKRLRNPQAAKETDIFVYLAGHGFPDLATGQPYLIPYDVRPEQPTNGINLSRLYQVLNGFGARSVTVFVEACFSGASGYQPGGEPLLLAANMNPVFPVVEAPIIGPNIVVFSATSGRKPSNNRDDLKHGIFTYFLLKGLGGAGDLDGDKAVTIAELYTYLKREVPRKALEGPLDREQIPQLQPPLSRLGERGNFVLVEY